MKEEKIEINKEIADKFWKDLNSWKIPKEIKITRHNDGKDEIRLAFTLLNYLLNNPLTLISSMKKEIKKMKAYGILYKGYMQFSTIRKTKKEVKEDYGNDVEITPCEIILNPKKKLRV